MNGKATQEETDLFIRKYNERVQWNTELRQGLDEKFLSENRDAGSIIDEWLPTRKLTDENTDTADAQIYEINRHDGSIGLELQAFDKDNSRWSCWYTEILETEVEYKKKTVSLLLGEIRQESDRLAKDISDSISAKERIDTLLAMAENISI